MAREIKSPKINAARKEVVAVQSATTKIKEIIVSDIDAGVDKQETTKKIAKIIAEVAKDISDPQLLRETKQSLAMSTQKWYYEYSVNSKTIREATKQNIKQSLSRASSAKIKGRTYNLGEVFSAFDNAETNNAFRGVVENFRPFIDDARKGLPTIANYDKLLKGQLKVLASDPPISRRVNKAGKPYRVNLRNRAEMFVRYEVNRQDLQALIDDGVEYAWISSHADASPRCSPYQGKLYSLKNEKGSVDGHRYYPIEDALKGHNGDGNGCISGYNCRHRLIEYTPNSQPPNDYTSAEIQKEYKIDAKQRSYENRIRNLKLEERVFRANGNTEEASKLRKRWRRLNKDYEIYSVENGRAFYRWRTIVRDDETQYKQENNLQVDVENDIIEEKKDLETY